VVILFRSEKEVAAAGASDAENAARQAAILILRVGGGLKVGDVIQISRI